MKGTTLADSRAALELLHELTRAVGPDVCGYALPGLGAVVAPNEVPEAFYALLDAAHGVHFTRGDRLMQIERAMRCLEAGR